MNRRLTLAWISAVAMLALPGAADRVHTQGARGANTQLPTPNSQGPRPAWAWKPAIPTGNDGQVHVLPVRGRVYMLVGAGGNITVQAGDEGVLIVDAGAASMSDKVLAAIRTISRGPLRYIINTDEREEFTGGNEKLAAAGTTISFRVATDPRFGKTTGPWTTDMFIEAVYRSLGGK
jgi:glyoxylase-like metal-dependent hydrolase (beta-lactamase superfamily II)